MADDKESTVPEGAAVFPLIPPELGVHPLLLGVLHATVFLMGSAEDVVDPEAAGETADYIAGYLQRLTGAEWSGFAPTCRRWSSLPGGRSGPSGRSSFSSRFWTTAASRTKERRDDGDSPGTVQPADALSRHG